MIMDFDLINNILLFFFILYFIQSAILIYGLFIDDKTFIENSNEPVSIIVAARNEELNIEHCLNSLIKIDYPKSLYEIIIVDDGSTDRTAEIIHNFAKTNSNIRYLSSIPSSGNLKGKANALDQAIKIASNDIIMITDADCEVMPTWVSHTVKYFDESVGVLAGFTLLKIKNWFDGLQSLDWTYILSLSASTINLKIPLSCIGNNYCFRKTAYNEVGGYTAIKFSVTEDYSLFKAIINSGKWKYRFPMDKNRLVFSQPSPTWKLLFQQKRRWAVGGLEMKLSGILMMTIAFLFHLLLLISFFNNSNFTIPFLILLSKAIIDFIYLFSSSSFYNYKSQLKYFIHFQIYFIISLFSTPFTAIFGGKVKWKGREF